MLPSDTREQILQAALKQFADFGYAGTAVQDIVSAAHVTKPALYYHFGNKAGLYKALLEQAHREQVLLIKGAASRGTDLQSRLTEIFTASLQFAREHAGFTRLIFSTAYGSPNDSQSRDRYGRAFEFIHNMLKKELISGELERRFESEELANTLFGLMNVSMLTQVLHPARTLDRACSERTVKIFLDGTRTKRALTFSR